MSTPLIYPHLLAALDRFHGVGAAQNTDPPNAPRRGGRSNGELKILLCTFWKYPTAAGGLSNYLTALKSGLEKRGHRVDIIHPERFDPDELRRTRERAKSDVERVFRERYKQPVNGDIVTNLQYMLGYEAMLAGRDLGKYDVFHAQDRFTANVLSRLNRSYNKPLFFTPHGPMTHERLRLNLIKQGSEEEAYYSQVDRRAVEAASKVIILSETFRPTLATLGADGQKLETIYTGIDFDPGSSKAKDDRIVISCVSRLGPRKGHKILLEALRQIKDDLRHVRVNIVGDGEMKDELERLSSKLHLDHEVRFLGHRDDVDHILRRSNIYVLPTTSDTLPISVIEAMFAGNAIVTTRCGGIPEIVRHDETGLLADPGNVDQLAACLRHLLRDHSLIKRFGRNARQYAEANLTLGTMSSKIENAYRSALHG